jgi:hypothetical protein
MHAVEQLNMYLYVMLELVCGSRRGKPVLVTE